jgi:hypothetical protein
VFMYESFVSPLVCSSSSSSGSSRDFEILRDTTKHRFHTHKHTHTHTQVHSHGLISR